MGVLRARVVVWTMWVLTLAGGATAPAADTQPLFRFGHMSDIHYVSTGELAAPQCRYHKPIGTRAFNRMPEIVPTAVAMLRQQKAAFALVTGDCLETMQHADSRFNELRGLFGQLPARFVPGNHDIEIEKLATPVRSDYHFTCGGLRFVVIRSSFHPGCRPIVEREALENLARVLDRYRDEPVVVTLHSPLRGGPDWAPPVNHAVVRRVLQKAGNVVLVLSGHIHAFVAVEENGIRYVMSSGFVDTPGHPFLVWTVYPDRLEARGVSTTGKADHHGQKIADMTVTVAVPQRLRAKLHVPGADDLTPLPAPSLLLDWFGPTFEVYPGSRPKHLPDARPVVTRGSNGWRVWVPDTPRAKPAPGAGKTTWRDATYDDSAWRPIDLPAGYGKYGIPRVATMATLPKAGAPYLFRKTFTLEAVPAPGRGLLAVASDKVAQVYLNGQSIDAEPKQMHHLARYWNRYVWFDTRTLRKGANTVAVWLRQVPSSHAFLDLELSVPRPRLETSQ